MIIDDAVFRLLYENCADAVLCVDGDRFADCNDAAVRMFRCENKRQVLSLAPYELSPEHQPDGSLSKDGAKAFIAEAMETGSARFEWVHRGFDGQEFPVEVLLTAPPVKGKRILFAVLRDIARRKSDAEAVKTAYRTTRDLLEKAPYGIMVSDRTGKFVYVNPEFTAITGYGLTDIPTGRDWFRKAFPDTGLRRDTIRAWKDDILRKGATRVISVTCKDGSTRDLELKPTLLDDGRAITNVLDVTDRKQAEELFKILANSSPIGIYIVQNGKLEFMNPLFLHCTGYNESELLHKDASCLVFPEDCQTARMEAIQMLKGERLSAFEHRVVSKSGETRWILESVSAIQYKHGQAVLGNFIDITDRKLAEGRMRYLSLHDNLTGLYNRAYLEEEMTRLANARFNPVGIVIGDVDGLKLVNDILGHSQGDILLMAAADVMKKCFRSSDVVARVGGDEFAVILPNTPNEVVAAICERIQDTIRTYNAENPSVALSISLGFATKDESSTRMSELFREADNNMYSQKLCQSKAARSAIVDTLMKILEKRGVITENRVRHIEALMTDMGKALGLSGEVIQDLRLFSKFRDIGEVGISDSIFDKSGMLTLEEVTEVHRHCEIGYRIAMSTPELTPISEWILKHHEWWDGNGYPMGLKGTDIPAECRMLSLCIAYDAMINDRPYRKAMPSGQVVEELKRLSGSQFDPSMVSIFFQVLHERQEIVTLSS